MNSPARVWLTVGPIALAAGGGTLALVLASEHEEQQILTSVFGLLIGWAFVAAGLIARTRRPENRTGVLLVIVGFSFFAGALAESNWSLPFSIGFVLGSIFVAALIHALLAYPSGRLVTRWQRAVVVLSYATALLANLLPFLFEDTPNDDCKECPANAFLIVESPTAHDVATVVFESLAVVLALVVAVTLFMRWRASSPAARRLLGPVLLVGGGTLLLFGISIALSPISSVVATVIALGAALLFMAVPFVFLWGVLRSRLARSEVGALLADAEETPTLMETQEALRVALRDPTVELVYRLDDPGGYFKVDGQRLRLEDVGHGRAVTEIESRGEALAAIIHDPALLAEPELLSSVCLALRLRLEKDRTVRALSISEYRSRALLDAIPDTMFRLARDGTVLDIHSHDPENVVMPPAEMIGTNLYDIPSDVIARETMEERKVLVERAFETGEAQTQEYEINMPTGGRRFAETRIVPSGENEFVMIVRDVTEEKRTEFRGRALLDAIPDAMFRLSREGRFLDFHTQRPELLVIAAEEIVGSSVYDIPPHRLAPEVVRKRMELAERAFATGEVQTHEYEMRTPEGKTMYSEARIVPSGEDEWVMIVRDVTESRLIESRNQALLEALPDAVFRLTREGIYLDFRSPDAERRGVDPQAFIGTSIENALPPDVVSRVMEAAEQAFATGEVQTVEGELEYGGGTIYAEARIVPSGENEFVMIVRDVTDRVRHQEELETERAYLTAVTDATPSVMCRIDYEGKLGKFGLNLSMQRLLGYAEGELAGRRFSEAISAPEDAETVDGVIAAVAAGETPGERETVWLTKDGRRLIVAWTCTPLPARGVDKRLQISGTDVTERRRREDEQAALSRVAVAVASERRAEEVFHTVTREVGQLLGATRADMIRFDARRDEALIVGVWGRDHTDKTELGRWMTPVQGGPTRAVWESGETMRFEPDGPVSERLRGRLLSMGISSTVVAPVSLSGRVWGAISVWVNEGRLPLETEERIARFTALVATALANTEAREELLASRARIVEAGDAERRRLERNLHDGAQQRLVSLSLSLRLAQAKLASDAHAADEILSGASVELALALEELRELARGIHPAVLTDRGLGPALESLADRTPIPIEFERLPADRLPPPVEAAAFYVVSEALANVAKYAEASSVSVSVAQEDGYAVVEVADNGVGGADPTGGSGLRGLSDRVAALEGRLAIVSPPGAGTRIRAEIPCGR
jgi:PAS domain S-box-containing protein